MSEGQKRQRFQLSLGDIFSLVTAAGLSVAVYFKIRSSYQPPWEPHPAKDAFAALFVFLVCSGTFAALAGRKTLPLVLMAIALQILSALALAIPTFGFDHQSEWGLDFADLIFLWFAWGVAFIGGLAVASVYDHAKAISLQLWLVPILGALVVVVKAIRANI